MYLIITQFCSEMGIGWMRWGEWQSATNDSIFQCSSYFNSRMYDEQLKQGNWKLYVVNLLQKAFTCN
jgi:hypothetical protein